ncbi:MAG: tRNA preQ1(34) S-adenosylmethionine ribosyltransferase-isomerase QueA [Pseudomonadota bacterium]
MQLKDFDYDLPEELIAQTPLAQRTRSRLLQLTAEGLKHGEFEDLATLLKPGDLLVLNNTRVIKARLFGKKSTGGAAELLVERVIEECTALCQVRVSKALGEGGTILTPGGILTVLGREGQFYRLRFPEPVFSFLDQWGEIPLPPYIQRSEGEPDSYNDEARYQTVFSSTPGAVAAPTAGLHFDDALLDRLKNSGVRLAQVTLHVGAGTFQPVRGDIGEHVMHSEWCEIDASGVQLILETRAAGGRVIAVGTTVVRTLESVAARLGELRAWRGDTDLFIQPGFQFRMVDALITNFHLPRSTLLMLVAAFAGYDNIMRAYQEAVAQRYRFFSYGDAMWLTRST